MIDATGHQEYLINEILRFYDQYERPPRQCEMIGDDGYPSADEYLRHFDTWSEVLLTAAHEVIKQNEWKHYIGS